MSYLIKPAGYKALLNLSQTEMGIKKIKDFFQQSRIWTMPKLKSSIRLPNGNDLLLLIIKSKKATVSIPT